MKHSLLLAAGLIATLGGVVPAAKAPDPPRRLAVHEWGTFTALQAEDGQAVPGINTDDEPLPPFVHDLHGMLIGGPTELPNVYFKGMPRVHPDVIVRLETPVIYFHPPAGAKLPMTIDVDVSFKGGWLTQFYPDAKAVAPGLDGGRSDFGSLRESTVGTLSWKGLKVGGETAGPETTSPVWITPRKVDAASVSTPGGETERYLFYRGVGHVEAPLKVTRSAAGEKLLVITRFAPKVELQPEFASVPMLLVDVRDDGVMAFRSLGKVNLAGPDGKVAADLPGSFAEKEYAASNRETVRSLLHAALRTDGLNADEADALLNTWDASYFRRAGLRLFFLVPRQWTDQVLPLTVSGSSDLVRTMVGRIEIVTPHQRELLKEVSKGPVSSPRWVEESLRKAGGNVQDAYREEWFHQLIEGAKTAGGSTIEVPPDYRAYLGLGRFRNALILDEQIRRPSPNLAKFIDVYDLRSSETKERTP